ncbi:MAG TPA: hypothetical protein VL981_06870, partial [Candidatus Methylacidiphilales bacterium]|nr:hypothetical protein [Candidatus Methylacidiphilales bacterium]
MIGNRKNHASSSKAVKIKRMELIEPPAQPVPKASRSQEAIENQSRRVLLTLWLTVALTMLGLGILTAIVWME